MDDVGRYWTTHAEAPWWMQQQPSEVGDAERPVPAPSDIHSREEHKMTRIALVLAAAMLPLTASLAEAQTTASFERLGLLVNQGDRVTVTDHAGQEFEGRLMDLSPTTLSLQIDNCAPQPVRSRYLGRPPATARLAHEWRPAGIHVRRCDRSVSAARIARRYGDGCHVHVRGHRRRDRRRRGRARGRFAGRLQSEPIGATLEHCASAVARPPRSDGVAGFLTAAAYAW